MHSPQQPADQPPARDSALQRRIALLEAQMVPYAGGDEPAGRLFDYGADGTLRYAGSGARPAAREAEPAGR
ncbi:MAG TPA: hypothetical protein VGE07_19315 [Herpetosiphonaceae bacterium]